MRNEQDVTKSPTPATDAHDPALAWRLILAAVVCLVIIGAAVAYERFG